MDNDALLPRTLDTLTDAERDHVAIGLEHAFGATLVGEKAIGWTLYTNLFEDNERRIGLDGNTVTVGDLWNVAKATP